MGKNLRGRSLVVVQFVPLHHFIILSAAVFQA
jgi:hypothetical protein